MRARVPLLLVVVLVTAVAAVSATRLTFNFSPDNLFMSGDAELSFFLERVTPAFGDAGASCVLVVEGDLKTAGVQAALVDATRTLGGVDGVQDVTSLVDVELPTLGALGFGKLFDAKGRATVENLLRAARDPTVGGMLVGADLDISAVLAPLAGTQGNDRTREAVVARLTTATKDLATRHPTVSFHLAGVPVSHEVIVSTLQRDQVRFIPLVVLVMGLMLFISFRDVRGVVLPFLATACAAVWCVGAMAAAGHSINVVNNAIVVLLLVVGVADGVHFVARFFDELQREREHQEGDDVDRDLVLARTVAAMALPCFLTTTTTSVGFLGALVAKMHLVREFGLDAALGVAGAFFATMIVVPSLLGLLPLPKSRGGNREHTNGSIERVLDWTCAIATKSPARLTAVFAVGAVGLGALAMRVEANQTLLSELPSDSAPRIALNRLEEKLAGVLPVEVIYEFAPDDSSRALAPDTIRHMARLDERLEAGAIGPAVGIAADDATANVVARVRSLPDVYASVANALGGDLVGRPVSRWSDADIRQIQLLFDLAPSSNRAAATRGLVSADGTLARLIVLVPDVGTLRFVPFRDALRREVEPAPPATTVRVSGGQVIATNALETVTSDMISSVVLAFLLIFIFVMALFRSVVVGLLALVPNALPVAATLAAMGAFHVPLRLATVLTFCMALGVAVDACIHLLARLREEMQRCNLESEIFRPGIESEDDTDLDREHQRRALKENLQRALERTMRGAGRPVVVSTLLLLCGFGVLGMSEFGGLRDFALLSAATLSCALVVDLLLLPALVALARPRMR